VVEYYEIYSVQDLDDGGGDHEEQGPAEELVENVDGCLQLGHDVLESLQIGRKLSILIFFACKLKGRDLRPL
jgi:hypothetical protein